MLSFSDKYVLLCAIASLLFGYQIAVPNTTMTFFTLDFNACGNHYDYKCPEAKSFESWASSIVFFGATLGSLAAGNLRISSRRTNLILAHVFSVLGSAVCIFAYNYPVLITGRFLVGVCVGFVTVASPTFISEISPDKTRGSRGVMHQLAITVGILLPLFLGLCITSPPAVPDSTYIVPTFERYFVKAMVALPGIISVIVLILMFFVYRCDTPAALLQAGKTKAARDVLCCIYPLGEAEKYLEEHTSQTSNGIRRSVGIWKILTDKVYRKPFIIGIILSIGQHVSGINAFVVTSNKIFTDAHMSATTASRASALMAVVNVLMTFPSILLIDTFGRKPLLLIGTLGQTLFLSLVPIVAYTQYASHLPIVAVVAVVGFIIFFAIAEGPVLWVYLFEMYPLEIKSFCTSVASALNWVASFVVVYLSHRFSSDESTVPRFTIFSVLSFLTFLFTLVFVIETKGCSRSPYEVLDSTDSEEYSPLTVKEV